MKKFIKSIALLIPALTMSASCSMFKLDNFDGPNAQVNGKIMDIVTGEKIGIEAATANSWDWSTWSNVTTVSYGSLVVIEQGWDAEADQDWMVRFDGMYTNNLVFAGEYRFSSKKLPCYEPSAEKNTFILKQGKNRVDIGLLPFCRIHNPQFSYNATTKKLVATFYVELGDPSRANQVTNVAFCANTQLFVGCSNMNLAKDDPGAKAKNVQPGELITLEIDTTLGANANLFKYSSQDRYLRLAAMAEGNGYNSNKYYNFTPVYKISADFSKVEEVTWNENEW